MTEIDKGSIDYKSEVLRKLIHLFSLSIPVIYYFVTKELALSILVPLTLFSLFLDFGRYYIPALKNFFNKTFGFMMREHERDEVKKNLSGATYVLISATVGVIIFPKIFFITAFAVLILSDIAAALVGRKYGRHKFLAKSLEGTLAFFITGCIVVLLTPKINYDPAEYFIGFFAVAVGAIAENISYGWADDNFMIPLSVGFTLWLLYYLFLPDFNLVLANVPL